MIEDIKYEILSKLELTKDLLNAMAREMGRYPNNECSPEEMLDYQIVYLQHRKLRELCNIIIS